MPPKLTAKNPRPAFKPPRPVKTSNTSTTSKSISKPSAKPTRPPTSKTKPSLPSRDSSVSPSPTSDADPVNNTRTRSSSSSSSSDDDIRPPATKSITSQPPAIPAKLLTRLLHEHFQPGTRITREASEVVAAYMETFVAEAIARAVQERRESGADEGFLEVEDLEKLAPQMLLDF